MPPRSLTALERAVLTGPGAAARTAAAFADDPEQRWMLSLPRDARLAYATEVLGNPDDEHAEERWMLMQPDEVCRSYVREVLDRQEDGAPEERWLLLQPRAVRESYVRDVLSPV